MIIKIKIKKNRKEKDHQIFIWLENNKKFKDDLKQLFQFYNGSLKIQRVIKIRSYYKITSENPAILLSIISTINDLIPELYFFNEDYKLD